MRPWKPVPGKLICWKPRWRRPWGPGSRYGKPKAAWWWIWGPGATEAAVLTQGKIAVSRLLRQGGRSLDEALVQYSRKKYNLLIGSLQAEQVKIEIGTVRDTVPPAYMDLRGRDLITGLPRSVTIDQNQLQEACGSRSTGWWTVSGTCWNNCRTFWPGMWRNGASCLPGAEPAAEF